MAQFSCRFSRATPPDVQNHDGDHHAEDVLDAKEAQPRLLHAKGNIFEEGFGKRAENEIERKA
jgi:hypothetical protein